MPGEEGAEWSTTTELRRRLHELSAVEFSHLVADLWRRQGWRVDVLPAQDDVDARARKDTPYPKKALLHTRHDPDTTIGTTAVDQAATARIEEPETSESIIVTPGKFSERAHTRAREENIILLDGDALVTLIDTVAGADLLARYREQSKSGTATISPGHPAAYHRRLTHAKRERIESTLDNDFEELHETASYQAQQALAQAETTVELQLSEAVTLGVFAEIPWDVESHFEERKVELAFRQDDLHVTQDGDLFVGDLRQYLPQDVIQGHPVGPVIAFIDSTASTRAWVAENRTLLGRVHMLMTRVRRVVANSGPNWGILSHPRVSFVPRAVMIGGILAWCWLGLSRYGPLPALPFATPTLPVLAVVSIPLGMVADAIQNEWGYRYPKRTALFVVAAAVPWIGGISAIVYLSQHRTE